MSTTVWPLLTVCISRKIDLFRHASDLHRFPKMKNIIVSNSFSLYFVYLYYSFISRFGFNSGICLLIAPVPVHCFSITFTRISTSAVLPSSVETTADMLF